MTMREPPPAAQAELVGIPFVNSAGRKFHRPIGLVTLGAFGVELVLSDLVHRAVQLAKGLDASLWSQAAGKSPGGSDLLAMATFEFGGTEQAAPEA